MKPITDSNTEFRRTNDENTVGVLPVRNAAGQKPIAVVRAEFLHYAAKLIEIEYGNPSDYTPCYLWAMPSADNVWLALSPVGKGQYPDEAVVIAGLEDRGHELVP